MLRKLQQRHKSFVVSALGSRHADSVGVRRLAEKEKLNAAETNRNIGADMRLHVDKRGLRVLGVAESFDAKRSNKAILAGVVMRGDLVIDGFVLGSCKVGGMDATMAILDMFRRLDRNDVNAIMLNGCVISWFNVIDLGEVHSSTGTPVVCVTYESSEGLTQYFKEYFPDDWERRVSVYERNGERTPVELKTGYTLFARCFGAELPESMRLLNKFTLHGRVPEPLRISKTLARSLLNFTSPSFPRGEHNLSDDQCREKSS